MSEQKFRKIAVIGGTGRTGSSLVKQILQKGYQPCGNPFELYYSSGEDAARGKFDLDICIPVKPL
jgi:predicted dinucleotide-binding enzyme